MVDPNTMTQRTALQKKINMAPNTEVVTALHTNTMDPEDQWEGEALVSLTLKLIVYKI